MPPIHSQGIDTYTKVLQIAELLRQAGEIADTIAVAVIKRAHVQFVNQRILIP